MRGQKGVPVRKGELVMTSTLMLQAEGEEGHVSSLIVVRTKNAVCVDIGKDLQ